MRTEISHSVCCHFWIHDEKLLRTRSNPHEITGQEGSWFHMIADSSSNGSFPPTQKWLCGPPKMGWSMVNLIHDNSNNLPWQTHTSLQNSSTAIRNTWKHCKMEWGCARLHLHRLIEYPAACPCCRTARTAVIWLSRPQWEGRRVVPKPNFDAAHCNRLHLGLWLILTVDIPRHAATMAVSHGTMEHWMLLCLLSAVLVF